MASTLQNKTLTIRVIEEITHNGAKKLHVSKHEIKSINEISERTVSVLTTGTSLAAFDTAAAAGTFVRDDVRHLRITNLDDTNFIRLALITDGTDVHVKVTPLDSFILTNGNAAAGEDSNAISFDNITSIKAWADTATVDVEMFIASS